MELQQNFSQTPETTENIPTQTTPSKNKLSFFLILVIVILTAASAVAGYTSFIKSEQINDLVQFNTDLLTELENTRNKQASTEIPSEQNTSSQTYFNSKEENSIQYLNSDFGYEFSYPESLIIDTGNMSLSGDVLGDKKIFIETSIGKLSDCTENCDEIRKIGTMTINGYPTNIYLGAKKQSNGEFTNQYYTYEIIGNSKNTYISYQFENESIMPQHLEVLTKIATSFKYRPDLVSTKTEKIKLLDLPVSGKPVIYLYPEKTLDVSVKLNFNGNFISTYPDYGLNGWRVKAFPDGKLINYSDNKEYSYLFWDGYNNWKFSEIQKGFVVPGKDTAEFLQNKLAEIGLKPHELNEFIVYWLPLMENNNYNLIHFAQEEYTKNAELDIVPKPDSMLRVFMLFKPLETKLNIEPQQFEPFNRDGFTVVEWGGTKL